MKEKIVKRVSLVQRECNGLVSCDMCYFEDACKQTDELPHPLGQYYCDGNYWEMEKDEDIRDGL